MAVVLLCYIKRKNKKITLNVANLSNALVENCDELGLAIDDKLLFINGEDIRQRNKKYVSQVFQNIHDGQPVYLKVQKAGGDQNYLDFSLHPTVEHSQTIGLCRLCPEENKVQAYKGVTHWLDHVCAKKHQSLSTTTQRSFMETEDTGFLETNNEGQSAFEPMQDIDLDLEEKEEPAVCSLSVGLPTIFPPRMQSCGGPILKLNDCKDNLLGVNEAYLIALRTGKLANLTRDETICHQHRTVFGVAFKRTLNAKKCMKCNTTFKKDRKFEVTVEQNELMLKLTRMTLPVSGPVCSFCLNALNELKNQKEARQDNNLVLEEDMDVQDEEGLPATQSTIASQETEMETDDDYTQSQPYSFTSSQNSDGNSKPVLNQRDKFYEFVNSSSFNIRIARKVRLKKRRYKSIDRATKWNMRSNMAKGIGAMLESIIENKDDRQVAWADLKQSGFVERYLDGEAILSGTMREIINALNRATSRHQRIQILSNFVTRFRYRDFAKHNVQKRSAKAEETQTSSESSDAASDEESSKDTEIQEKMPCINPPLSWRLYKAARIHFKRHGLLNEPVVKAKQKREKISPEVIDAVFDFVTGDEVTQNVAYGTYQIKNVDGNKTLIAKVIRRQHNADLIRLIQSMLRDCNLPVLSESTLSKMLRLMPAAKCKTMQGVDSSLEAERRGFQTLHKILDEIEDFVRRRGSLSLTRFEYTQTMLSASEQYIKSHFMYNISLDDPCANHCARFATSDPKVKVYRSPCTNHKHTQNCKYCDLLPSVIEKMKDLLKLVKQDLAEISPIKYEECLYEIDIAHGAINTYKQQLLRNFITSSDVEAILQEANPKVMILEADFAMKYLPAKYRQSQEDWYAQRGMVWHLCAAQVCKKADDGKSYLDTDVHVSIVKDGIQNANCVVGLILSTLKLYKQDHPDVTDVWIKSDNAGCYHSEKTIVSLWSQRNSIPGLTIKGFKFSEAGKGKSTPDQYCAIIKRKVAALVSSGFDADTEEKFAEAIVKGTGVKNVKVCVGQIDTENIDEVTPKQVGEVSKLHDFVFEDDGIICRKVASIGDGLKLRELDGPDNVAKYVNNLVKDESQPRPSTSRRRKQFNEFSSSGPMLVKLSAEENISQEDEEEFHIVEHYQKDELDEETRELHSRGLYPCPNDLCILQFESFRQYEAHKMSNDTCIIRPNVETMSERITKKYIAKFGISPNQPVKNYQEARKVVVHLGNLPEIDDDFITTKEAIDEGHALPPKRSQKRFSNELKSYLIAIFKRGINSKSKAKPEDVAKEMRSEVDDNGYLLFTKDEWLLPSQIKSYFARLSAEKRFNTKEPNDEEIEECHADMDLQDAASTQVNVSAELQRIHENLMPCPIKVSGVDLCDLSQSILKAKKKTESDLYNHEPNVIIKIGKKIGPKGLKTKSVKKIGALIVQYVQDNCRDDCCFNLGPR